MKTAIIGGGAAGVYCAIWLGTLVNDMEIIIFEQQKKMLSKVEISGGGRCNCTNSFKDVTDLVQVYPRGAKLMKKLFKEFGPKDTFEWFENHGVPLIIQEDNCVFPHAQDSHVIIDCFMNEIRRLGVKLQPGVKVDDPMELLKEYDYVVVTVGGLTNGTKANIKLPVELIPSVPSLFAFNIKDKELQNKMGVVVEGAVASIPGTAYKAQGPLLITHRGMSGPAILKLSGYAARYLADNQYQSPLAINWTRETNTEVVRSHLVDMLNANGNKLINNTRPFGLQARLWEYLIGKASIEGKRCNDIGKKHLNRLAEILTNDQYHIDGRCHYKEEFVTCGGVALNNIVSQTLESKQVKHLYFAGEVLDIDGITGGFNFQAAWSTAYTVAKSIASTTGNDS